MMGIIGEMGITNFDDVEKKNMLIANFMRHDSNITDYSKSFDSIIRVLERIRSLGYGWKLGTSNDIPYHFCKIESIEEVEAISALDAAWGACVEFIIWYDRTLEIMGIDE